VNELAERGHLSIGEVLNLLKDEFPDITISKIRFLESQGLLDPERTPSGYRKFYDEDIDRLRSILRLQKEHYLPLKVIKDRLDSGASANGASEASSSAGPARPVSALPERPKGRPALAEAPPPPPRSAPTASTTSTASTASTASTTAKRSDRGTTTGRSTTSPALRQGTGSPRPGQGRPPSAAPLVAPPNAVAAGGDGLSLSVEELAEAGGLSVRDIRDLERFGLIEARDTGGASSYDGDALIVAQTAAGFLQHGIEARHMRSYKVAVDREAGLFEQIVSPVLKQRNPEARTRASRTVTELIRLGEVMRGVLLRRELRDHLGGR